MPVWPHRRTVRPECGYSKARGWAVRALEAILCDGIAEVDRHRRATGRRSASAPPHRTIPPKLRRFVLARDGGCVVEGCTSHVSIRGPPQRPRLRGRSHRSRELGDAVLAPSPHRHPRPRLHDRPPLPSRPARFRPPAPSTASVASPRCPNSKNNSPTSLPTAKPEPRCPRAGRQRPTADSPRVAGFTSLRLHGTRTDRDATVHKNRISISTNPPGDRLTIPSSSRGAGPRPTWDPA